MIHKTEFRGIFRDLSMLVLTLHFIRNNERDEVLKVFRKRMNTFKCCFYPSDIPSCYEFYLTKYALFEYIRSTLRMVADDDIDPYEQVQVSTMIHPRILFHVSDINKPETYERMLDMIEFGCNCMITKNGNRLSVNRPTTNNAHAERVSSSQTGRNFSSPNPEDADSETLRP